MIDTIALALNKRNLTWKVKVDGLNHDKQPYSWLEEKKKKKWSHLVFLYSWT